MQHLSERDRPPLKAPMRKARRETDHPRALEQLTRLAAGLDHPTPEAPARCARGWRRH
jgi:hypothetical protein